MRKAKEMTRVSIVGIQRKKVRERREIREGIYGAAGGKYMKIK